MSVWNLANPNLRQLVPYEPGKPIDDVARELGLDPANIIKLASNENPLGPSPKAVAAMEASLRGLHIYPDGGSFHLRNAIAEKMGVDRSMVVLGNGSNEIIELAYHAFGRAGTTSAVASRHAFVVYQLMAQLFDVTFIAAPDRDFHHDLDAIRAAIRPDTRLVFIANPNNPTGTRIPNEPLESFVRSLPPHVVCVLDEAYYEFLENPPASVEWVRQGLQVIVLRTFSKIQGLAGLRVGYGIASPETAEILQRCRQPFNANSMAQAGALAGLGDDDHMARTRAMTLDGRARLQDFFRGLGLRFVPSEANFVFVEVGEADRIFKALLREGIIIRSMTSYGLPAWVRVSIGTPEQMRRFEEAFSRLLRS
ncbi:MAG: histidinol-phosphate transaminase [Candidatus Methylacidiphilales bacterium]|nr:histidinol-phosphate transaminase [Candidatus Methylacidiphilales bacterium]